MNISPGNVLYCHRFKRLNGREEHPWTSPERCRIGAEKIDKIKLYIFHTGKVRVDRAIPLHERNPLAVTGLFRSKAKQMILPVWAYS